MSAHHARAILDGKHTTMMVVVEVFVESGFDGVVLWDSWQRSGMEQDELGMNGNGWDVPFVNCTSIQHHH